MSDSLGLSIGMTNLVAARIGRAPVMRRSVLTLFNDRAPEVGVPGENPNLNQPGLVLSGFVERVGDPVPLVAADGSPHRGEVVLVEALDSMARTVGREARLCAKRTPQRTDGCGTPVRRHGDRDGGTAANRARHRVEGSDKH